MSFDYEITVLKSHPEIRILSPLEGEITGHRGAELAFSYSPQTFATAEAEIAVRTTEFDSEPCKIRLVGNAAPQKEPIQIDGGKTLLTSTKSYNP